MVKSKAKPDKTDPATDDVDYEPILDAQSHQLDLTISAGDSADAKSLGVFAAVLTIVIYSLQSLSSSPAWLLAILYVSFVASLVCSVLTFGKGDYVGPGIELQEHPEYFTMDRTQLTLQRISDIGLSISVNTDENTRKLRWLRRSFIGGAAGIACLIGCILIV